MQDASRWRHSATHVERRRRVTDPRALSSINSQASPVSLMYGHHGNYLRIDLSSRSTQTVSLSEDVLRNFIGGVGLGTWIAAAEGAATCNPLSANAVLAFVFSPLVGSPLTTSAKFAVCSKSPLTHRLNDSLSSSHFAIAGKKTGHDAIVITGHSERPVVLVVEPASIRFEDAADLWGTTTSQVQQRLRETLGASYRTAVIGPAGERLVRFATISHDRRHAGTRRFRRGYGFEESESHCRTR